MTTIEDVISDLAWVERLIAHRPELQATRHVVAEHNGRVTVEVQGAHYEVRAWRHAINGRIFPSIVDAQGVRRQNVMSLRVDVHVVEHPNGGA